MIFPSRSQLIRELSLTRTDQMEISKRRGDPHRLGFAYQLGFVRARDVYYGRRGRISARELHEQMTSCRGASSTEKPMLDRAGAGLGSLLLRRDTGSLIRYCHFWERCNGTQTDRD